MTNLTEMLKQLNDGAVISQLGQEFDLGSDQVEQAIEALTPAFSEGLKRNTADPQELGSFLEALSSGRHEPYAEDPGRATSAQGQAEGNAILGHLFRSKDLSRAVAAEAAQETGLSQGLLKKLLPILAPIILGGLFKQMKGGSQGRGNNPIGDILGELAGGRAGGNARQGNNPIGDILEQMMGGGRRQQRAPAPADNPLGRMLEDLLKGGGQSGGKSKGGGLGDIFGEMLEPGQAKDDRRVRQMESVFDDFLGGRQ